MNLPWLILKDGLKALAFWFVTSIIMILLWGYTGRMLSLGLGLIFIVSFIGVTLKRVVNSIPGMRQGSGFPAGPVGGPGSDPSFGGLEMRTCPQCLGQKSMNCYGCNGSGYRYNLSQQQELCAICYGQRLTTCSRCSGRGVVPV